tara:strand:+ start:126987 stop:127292 length:306 start_codon:yes stop_codon:yes gene_type:complete
MTFATLDVRGPCKLSDIDFAVDGMAEDGSFDLSNADAKELYDILLSHGIGLEMNEFIGPAGGNSNITLYGEEEVLRRYLEYHYMVGAEELLTMYFDGIEKV